MSTSILLFSTLTIVLEPLLTLLTGRKIRLGEENIDLFYETLKADVNLLQSLNIMDYSLLVSCIYCMYCIV